LQPYLRKPKKRKKEKIQIDFRLIKKSDRLKQLFLVLRAKNFRFLLPKKNNKNKLKHLKASSIEGISSLYREMLALLLTLS